MKDKKEQEVTQETKNTTMKAKKKIKWGVWIYSIIITIGLLILVFCLVKIGKYNYQKTIFFEEPKKEWFIEELKKPLMSDEIWISKAEKIDENTIIVTAGVGLYDSIYYRCVFKLKSTMFVSWYWKFDRII